jgi:hypothetical protein
MSKPSRRPTRQARKEHTQKRREAQRQLRTAQVQRGVVVPRAASISNRLCPYSTEAEEQAAREDAVWCIWIANGRGSARRRRTTRAAG